MRTTLFVAAIALCSCSRERLHTIDEEPLPEIPLVDAGEPDASEPDAGEVDAGEPDAGPVDAGEPDAGPVDAGMECGTLRAWYRFEDSEGPVEDSSGCGNHGVINGHIVRSEQGKVGNAFRLSESMGVGNVQVPNSATLRTSGSVSITAWAKRDNSGGAFIASWVNGSGGWAYYFGMSNSQQEIGLSTQFGGQPTCKGMTSFPDPNSTMPVAEWAHLAVTVDFATRQLTYYFNGELTSSRLVPADYGNDFCGPDSPLTIGGMNPQGSGQWNGLLDELKIWSVPLTAAEVCADSGGTYTGVACMH